MMAIRVVVWMALALLYCANAHARLLLVTSQESALYQEFQQGLTGSLARGVAQELEVRGASELAGVQLASYSAIVVAGVEAAKALAARGSVAKPVFYTMLPFSSYQWLNDNGLLAVQNKVLFIDQPPARYVQLARAAMPEMKSLGYLHGDVSKVYADDIKRAAGAANLEFAVSDVSADTKLSTLLKESFSGIDAMLLLPDPYLYNRRALQELLLASHRHKRPLLVYSESFVKAGAMVALFSTPEQIGRQSAEVINCLGLPCYNSIPVNLYPRYFSVVVNDVVARQMGVEVRSAEELQKTLESVEAAKSR